MPQRGSHEPPILPPSDLPPVVPAAGSANSPGTGTPRDVKPRRSSRRSPTPSRRTKAQHDDLTDQAIKTAPPWLLSAAFHMTLLILLGMMFLPTRHDSRIHLEAQTFAEQLGDQLDFNSPLTGDDEADDSESVITPDNLQEVEDPFAAPADLDIFAEGNTAVSTINAPQIGLALTGRTPGMKKALHKLYGGTALTEEAVQRGLKWLARNQDKRTGCWHLDGPYSNSSTIKNDSAATAMALLAFLGNGHTHVQQSAYTKQVQKGLKWLLSQKDKDGCFFHGKSYTHRFYTQAQCTIALCEALAMTRDESLREPATDAVTYLLDCQSPKGGWRYRPRADSDVSVTGWVVMALQSARMAGIEVSYDKLQQVDRFLDSVAFEQGSRYCYQTGWPITPAMTAEALLCRQYLGWSRNDNRLVRGVEWLTMPENLINYNTGRNVYYWYYASQVMHHMEGEPWRKWNEAMREQVPRHQVKEGAEAGSWDPWEQSIHDMNGGRLYVTCLSIYMLEVYYRHLPLYSSVYAK